MTWPNDIQSNTPAKYLFKLVSETNSIICSPEPLEWKSGSLEIKRDLESGGVFSTFQADSLTFVGNGAEFLKKLFEAYELNAKCTLIIYWWKFTTRSYVEFPSRFDINFNFYEKVKVGRFFFGIRVKAINSSTQTKLDNRQDIDVNLMNLVSIGNKPISDYSGLKKTIHYDSTNVFYRSNLHKEYDYNGGVLLDRITGSVSYTQIPIEVIDSEFTEIQAVRYGTKYTNIATVQPFFKDAKFLYETLEIYYGIICRVTQRHIGSFNWSVQIVETDPAGNIIYETVIGEFGGENRHYSFNDFVTVSCAKGNSLKFVCRNAGIDNTTAYTVISDLKITQQVTQSPEVTTEGFPLYEAIERTAQQILDVRYPIYSEFFGRQDVNYKEGVSYSAENQLRFAHVQSGMNLRGATLDNIDSPLALSFKKLFQSIKAIWNVGYSLEVNEALFGDLNQRIRIEEYSHFFEDAEVVFDPPLSQRITKYDIQSQVMPELVPVDLKSGFDSFEYLTMNGRSEPNTTNQRTSIMNTASKWENVSVYRGDTKGIYDNLSNPIGTSGTTDTKGDSSVFIIKSQKGTITPWKPEKAENITIDNDSSLFKDDLLNRYFTPSRMLIRHGNKITAGMTKYTSSTLKFQKTDKVCSLETSGTAQSEDDEYSIAENADIHVIDLGSPIYKAMKHTAIIPSWTFTDLEQLQLYPFRYLKFSDTISGYLLSFKKKNKEDKAEITIIEKY